MLLLLFLLFTVARRSCFLISDSFEDHSLFSTDPCLYLSNTHIRSISARKRRGRSQLHTNDICYLDNNPIQSKQPVVWRSSFISLHWTRHILANGDLANHTNNLTVSGGKWTIFLFLPFTDRCTEWFPYEMPFKLLFFQSTNLVFYATCLTPCTETDSVPKE